jgi:hypothetical protein
MKSKGTATKKVISAIRSPLCKWFTPRGIAGNLIGEKHQGSFSTAPDHPLDVATAPVFSAGTPYPTHHATEPGFKKIGVRCSVETKETAPAGVHAEAVISSDALGNGIRQSIDKLAGQAMVPAQLSQFTSADMTTEFESL